MSSTHVESQSERCGFRIVMGSEESASLSLACHVIGPLSILPERKTAFSPCDS